ncbi:MAG TPA: ABC transporter ATP-binding protein [Anaerovoracaceae bacterium]|nr:ABC transporter ATP-binding protein [Anaerovoracaceae bacterium]
MKEIITTDNLTKQYGKVLAVDRISLEVGKGEIYGFLGLNGAGKTTTIRMLLGMIRPTSGRVFINGKRVDPDSRDLWRSIGYIVEVPYSYPELTVRDNLEIVRRLRHIPDICAVDRIMDQLMLTSYKDRKVKNLSLGNAQRLGIAKALLHHPEILILDEPSNGLDPAGIVEIRALLLDLSHNHGVTVFISSHILGEISRLATRVGIIHQGRMVIEVDTNELERLRNKCLIINTRDKVAAKAVLDHAGYSTKTDHEGNIISSDERAINRPDEIACALVKAGIPPILLKVEVEDLETYFLRTIGSKEVRQA